MSSLPSKDQVGATIAVVFDLTRKFDDEVNKLILKDYSEFKIYWLFRITIAYLRMLELVQSLRDELHMEKLR